MRRTGAEASQCCARNRKTCGISTIWFKSGTRSGARTLFPTLARTLWCLCGNVFASCCWCFFRFRIDVDSLFHPNASNASPTTTGASEDVQKGRDREFNWIHKVQEGSFNQPSPPVPCSFCRFGFGLFGCCSRSSSVFLKRSDIHCPGTTCRFRLSARCPWRTCPTRLMLASFVFRARTRKRMPR